MNSVSSTAIESGEPATGISQLFGDMREKINQVLQPLLPAVDENIALIDFPNHANVGDSMIWLGEQNFLQHHGFSDGVYYCEADTYCREDLADAVGAGTIFLHGGGNLGDLWPMHQELREQVITDFPGNRIIQLPQSICFEQRDNLRRARRILEGHDRLTILTRDRPSLEFAIEQLGVEARLCPDLAFWLEPRGTPMPATFERILLYRNDHEASREPPSELEENTWAYDWCKDEQSELISLNTLLRERYCDESSSDRQRTRAKLAAIYPALAEQRFERGMSALARGGYVICERLHGHILCLLLGISHRIVDTRHDKIRNFVETWQYDHPLMSWADSPRAALESSQPE